MEWLERIKTFDFSKLSKWLNERFQNIKNQIVEWNGSIENKPKELTYGLTPGPISYNRDSEYKDGGKFGLKRI